MFSVAITLIRDSTPIATYSDINLDNLIQILRWKSILLGEINNLDIQLKGIGQTPFSRENLLSVLLREYIISEFMHALGPTQQLLALKLMKVLQRLSPEVFLQELLIAI